MANCLGQEYKTSWDLISDAVFRVHQAQTNANYLEFRVEDLGQKLFQTGRLNQQNCLTIQNLEVQCNQVQAAWTQSQFEKGTVEQSLNISKREHDQTRALLENEKASHENEKASHEDTREQLRLLQEVTRRLSELCKPQDGVGWGSDPLEVVLENEKLRRQAALDKERLKEVESALADRDQRIRQLESITAKDSGGGGSSAKKRKLPRLSIETSM
jgi:chromosome segregation ATPase